MCLSRNRNNIIDIIKDVSMECYMPVTVGGKIRSLEDIAMRLENGADKILSYDKDLDRIKEIKRVEP